MAIGTYMGVGGVARKVNDIYVGVDGVARKVTYAYVGDENGRARLVYTASSPVVLQVEKITSNTYASETTYENEEFIYLDIYPKSAGSVVNVTYGGVTKTLIFSTISYGRVIFGTFNGVSYDADTPSSGELVIKGDCAGFACGSYNTAKLVTANCGCITRIDEWGSLTSIPSFGFADCTNLTSIIIPDNITSIGAFGFSDCTNLTLSSLPSSIISIGDSAFYGCTNITLSSLPSGITSIGSTMFSHCTGITNFTIPDSVTSIGNSAFGQCTGLRSITIPAGVTSIGKSAFAKCTNLSQIAILATTPPTLGRDETTMPVKVFMDSTCNITVPKGCGEVYRNHADWSTYADRIVEAS